MLTGPEYQELLELRRLVQEQEQKIEQQSQQLRQQQTQIENLTQALLHARKKLFGPSTEVTQTEGQMSLFEQEELLHSLRQGQEEIVITEHKRKARQPGVRAEMIAALPVEVERCIVDPKEQCPVCKSPLIKVGEKSVRTDPGILKLPLEDIYRGGNSKSRNPHMQTMLRMVGFGDNAGSGFPSILATWEDEGWVQPELIEDTALNQVTLYLKMIPKHGQQSAKKQQKNQQKRKRNYYLKGRSRYLRAWS